MTEAERAAQRELMQDLARHRRELGPLRQLVAALVAEEAGRLACSRQGRGIERPRQEALKDERP